MATLPQTIQELPAQGWLPVLLFLILGFAMWAAGRRLLKPAFGALGVLVGGTGGWMLGEIIHFGVAPWMVAVIGALLAACFSVLAYRATVAIALTAVLGLASPAALWAMADPDGFREVATGSMTQPVEPEDAEPTLLDEIGADALDTWLDSLSPEDTPTAAEDEAAAAQVLPDEFDEHIAQARTLAAHLAQRGRDIWNTAPAALHERLVGATIVGGLLGLLAGTLAPTISASVVTSFGGAASWMIGLISALKLLELSEVPAVPTTTRTWLMLWLIFSVIGLLIQWTLGPKRADKPA